MKEEFICYGTPNRTLSPEESAQSFALGSSNNSYCEPSGFAFGINDKVEIPTCFGVNAFIKVANPVIAPEKSKAVISSKPPKRTINYKI